MKTPKPKTNLLLLTISLLTAGAASAATISYTFDTPDNISGTGAEQVYSAPDANDFGVGVSVGDFTITEANDADFSRFVAIGGGSVEATVQDRAGSETLSFTLTIDETVLVDLTSISFDTAYRVTLTGDSTLDWGFSTILGLNAADNETSGQLLHDGGTDYQSASSGVVALSGLTNLTNTTVTFEWEYDGSRSNLFSRTAMGLDDIVLTGTVSPIPEPSSYALVAGGLLVSVMRRRR
ncbi:MAG: PEP-CTERM sorting domain-containing protein [Verrucomicrobiales bacterium]